MSLTAFRLNELERKMLEAAGRQDYEAAIPLRDELRATRKALADAEPPPPPKCVDLFTRAAVEAPPEAPQKAQESPAEPIQDPQLIELLKDALEDAEAGKIHGGALFVGVPTADGTNVCNVMCSSTSKVEDHLNLFVGAMEVAKLEFHQVAQDMYFDDEEFDDHEE